MPASNSAMIKKLQDAINSRGEKLLYNKQQFYSEQQNRAVTVYRIKKAVLDEDTGKHSNIELFRSTSQIQIVLFLRDYWFELNGWELPTDNEMWSKLREDIKNENKVDTK